MTAEIDGLFRQETRMARTISKLEDLKDDLKTAEYLLNRALLRSGEQWLAAEVAKHQQVIDQANAAITEARLDHERAANSLMRLRRDVDMRNKNLAEWVNRGTIDKVEDVQKKLASLVAQMRALGLSEKQIKEAVG